MMSDAQNKLLTKRKKSRSIVHKSNFRPRTPSQFKTTEQHAEMAKKDALKLPKNVEENGSFHE